MQLIPYAFKFFLQTAVIKDVRHICVVIACEGNCDSYDDRVENITINAQSKGLTTIMTLQEA